MRVQVTNNGTNLFLERRRNALRLATFQLIREKANKQAPSKCVSLDIGILRTGENDMICAATHEAVGSRRRRKSSKDQLIILDRRGRQLG
jgi:hypothetical protein